MKHDSIKWILENDGNIILLAFIIILNEDWWEMLINLPTLFINLSGG